MHCSLRTFLRLRASGHRLHGAVSVRDLRSRAVSVGTGGIQCGVGHPLSGPGFTWWIQCEQQEPERGRDVLAEVKAWPGTSHDKSGGRIVSSSGGLADSAEGASRDCSRLRCRHSQHPGFPRRGYVKPRLFLRGWVVPWFPFCILGRWGPGVPVRRLVLTRYAPLSLLVWPRQLGPPDDLIMSQQQRVAWATSHCVFPAALLAIWLTTM